MDDIVSELEADLQSDCYPTERYGDKQEGQRNFQRTSQGMPFSFGPDDDEVATQPNQIQREGTDQCGEAELRCFVSGSRLPFDLDIGDQFRPYDENDH